MASRKRGQNEGSIYQRSDGRWCAVISIGNGRRRYVYGATASEAREKLHQLRQRIADGAPPDAKSLTVDALARQYLDSIQTTVRPKTHRRYETLLRLHVIPVIGQSRLERLQPGQLETTYARALANGSAPQTVVHIHRVIFAMLRQAERWQLTHRNVASLVKPPRVPHREMRVLNKDEVRRFLENARGTGLEAMWHLAIGTGMRLGELLGLQWKAVDFERGTLHVKSTLEWRAGKGPSLSEPKTRRSRRQLHLTDRLINVLATHRSRQLRAQLKLGPAWHDGDFVFTSSTGTPLRPENVTRRYFRPLLEMSGIEGSVRVHDLRHTAISLALAAGVPPLDVADMAGHSSVVVTLETYGHTLPGAPMRAVTAIEKSVAAD